MQLSRRGAVGALPLTREARVALVATLTNYVVYSAWTLLNKQLFGNFPFPLFATSVEMCVTALLAHLVISSGFTARQRPSPATLQRKILPLVVSRSIDIGLGNQALLYLSVPYQQVMKSLIPIFVCMFEASVVRRYVSPAVWGSMVPIVGGSIIASVGEGALLSTVGVVCQLGSCAGRASKAVINGLLLNSDDAEPKMDKYNVLAWEAPASAVLVGLVALFGEGGALFQWLGEASPEQLSAACGSLLACGVLMFFVQISYLQIIASTSSITTQVLMNFKMLLLIVVAILFTKSSPVTSTKVVGIAVTVAGGMLYCYVQHLEQRARREAERRAEAEKESSGV